MEQVKAKFYTHSQLFVFVLALRFHLRLLLLSRPACRRCHHGICSGHHTKFSCNCQVFRSLAPSVALAWLPPCMVTALHVSLCVYRLYLNRFWNLICGSIDYDSTDLGGRPVLQNGPNTMKHRRFPVGAQTSPDRGH